MKRTFLFTVLFIFSFITSWAQFATGGTGLYQRQIYWLPWYISNDTTSGLVSVVSSTGTTYNRNNKNIPTVLPSGTYTWKINNNIRIVGVLNIISGQPELNTINSYPRSGLQRMYTGLENTKMCIHTKHAQTVVFDLKLDFQINVSGNWRSVDPKYHGIVFADSESIDGTTGEGGKEEISALVDSSSNWYLIDIPKLTWKNNTNWISDYTFYSYDTSVNNKGYKKIKITNNNPDESDNQRNQDGAAFVMYAKGMNEFKNVKLVGRGYTNVMLGYFINSDPSNNNNYPSGYHFQENLISENGGTLYNMPASLRFINVINLSIPGAHMSTDVYIGQRPNVDNPYGDSLSNLAGMRQASNYYTNVNTDTLKYKVTVSNEFNTPAYLYAFLDINKDNKFSASEAVKITIPANTINGEFTLEWPNNIPNLTGDLTIRVRVTTDELLDNLSTNDIDERSIGMARNGEIVDGVLRILPENEYDPSALPVELIQFNGYAKGNAVNEIYWKTANESNIDHYILEYSTNGNKFESIAKEYANNNVENYYTFSHKVKNATSYYRLKIVENASSKYSNIVYVSNKLESNLEVYPNPATSEVHVNVLTTDNVAYIYNQMGRLVKEVKVNNGWNTIDIIDLEADSYIMKIGDDKYRFIKQ